ncbi:MAG TPA: DUF1634 domain-containing protein [Elusimicrobiota bacterium]|nr:DUF1634 domain-containing protein [Elusimicrobiota bacterium]
MIEKDEEALDFIIGYILAGGVILSIVLESYGLLLYCRGAHGFAVSWDPVWRMSGKNFFAYSAALFLSLGRGALTPAAIMALGLVVLMMTPYVRVVVSTLFFGLKRDWKYLCITLFVLAVLTGSLIRH